MELGALLTRLLIWLALLAYTAAEMGRTGLWAAHRPGAPRMVWSVGCALYVGHVVAAFTHYHRWSHDTAYDHVARQTADVVGLDWGGGIWVNYAFTALWLSETAWWWVAPAGYQQRGGAVDQTVRGVFLFMIVNGAVVFVDNPMRWLGVSIVVTLALTWSMSLRHVRGS